MYLSTNAWNALLRSNKREKRRGVHAQAVTRDLRDGAHRKPARRHQRDADDPLVADRRHLDDRAVVQWRDQGDDPVDREVECVYRRPRFKQNRFDGQGDVSHKTEQLLTLRGRQGGENPVLSC